MEYVKVNFSETEALCHDKLKQLNDNIDYVKRVMDTADKGVIAYESINSGEITNSNSTTKLLKRMENITTEAGRLYKLSAYVPKVYNHGTKASDYAGGSVEFIFKVARTTVIRRAYCNPGPKYRWCAMYIEKYLTPGDVTQDYQIGFAPTNGFGTAEIVTNTGKLQGYIKLEDKGPAR